jgi:hypothetical protein
MTKIAGMAGEALVKPIDGRAPAMNCPACGKRSNTRSSEEMSPETRRLYYRCPDIHCSMAWTAILSVEKVISPSGISSKFRPAKMRDEKPPGHDFGQMTIFEVIPKPSGA